MIELEPSAFHTIAPLFADIDHSIALVYAVLEGSSPGRILCDRRVSPRSALLLTHVGYSYVGGDPDNEAFAGALAPFLFEDLLPQMQEKELVLFAFSDAWRARLDALLRPLGCTRIQRKVFAFDPARFAAHAGWRARIPEGCSIRIFDGAFGEGSPRLGSVSVSAMCSTGTPSGQAGW